MRKAFLIVFACQLKNLLTSVIDKKHIKNFYSSCSLKLITFNRIDQVSARFWFKKIPVSRLLVIIIKVLTIDAVKKLQIKTWLCSGLI